MTREKIIEEIQAFVTRETGQFPQDDIELPGKAIVTIINAIIELQKKSTND